MKDVSQILYYRLVDKKNKFTFFGEKFKIKKSEFDMRGFFSEQIFLFLIPKYELIIKTK